MCAATIPLTVTRPGDDSTGRVTSFKESHSMTDILDPSAGEEVLMCMNCGCGSEPDPVNNLPDSTCDWQLCDCHSVYWSSVPELEKRRLWGDQ